MRGTTLFAAVAAVTMVASADTFTWTGGGANKNWSTAANWSPSGTMTASDTANFQTGTLSSDTIIYDSGAFAGITVQSGAWTANVASASFTGKPITVASGAKFALAGASNRTNPFSTTKNANYVAGLLDLGGATQTIADDMGGNDAGFFRNGGEIRNGNLTISGTPTAYLKNTTFTIGPGANVSGPVRVYLQDGANIFIDGGTFRSTTSGSNHPIGSNSSQSHLTVRNGGLFAVSKPVWIAHKGTGYMIGDGGTYDLGSSILYVGINNNTTAILALTNSTLICSNFTFGYNESSLTRQTVIIKDSVVKISKFVGVKLAPTASFLLDGAVVAPKAAEANFLPNNAAIPTPTLGDGGMIVSNNYDVTIAKGLAGAGKLVKKGDATLTLTGTHTFTGGIDLREGTLALDPNVSLANSTLTMYDGATLKLKYTPGVGFVTSNLTAALDASTSGNVTLDIDTSDGLPEEERAYTLFASVLDAASLSRISVFPALYSLAVTDGGAVTITLRHIPTTHTWTGGGADAKWKTLDNWDTDAAFGALDTVVFGGTGGYSIYDCQDVLITNITVESGAHTVNVASACFTDVPISVASGAEFKLEGANGAVNPFSAIKNANAIAGILDLGGASQTISDDMGGGDTGFFRNGGELRNGTLTISNPRETYAYLTDTTFTIGPNANVYSALRVRFKDGAHFVIDGGSFMSTFYTTGNYNNHPIGDGGGTAIMSVRNGGRFVATSAPVWLGFAANAILNGDCGIIDLQDNSIVMTVNNNWQSVLALTNSTFMCNVVHFGYGTGDTYKSPGTQTVILKDSIANITRFNGNACNANSSILFDGTTLVPKSNAANFLPNSATMPSPTLCAGGLIVSNAYDITIAKGMTGVGGLIKKGEGELTLSGANSFTGGTDVQEGMLVLDVGASFANSTLAMASGTTLKFKYSPNGGFATSNLVLSLDANLEGKVTIEIDTSAGLPDVNNPYTLFASGLDAASLDRIAIDSAYALAISDGGAVTLTFSPTTHTWTGGGADEKWTTTANWDTDDDFKTFDHVVFNSATGHSIYDCTDGLGLGGITAASGVHTANVATACFANVPVMVASGAELALENAEGVTNAFSTVANTNVIAGVLDLGGSTQTFSGLLTGNGAGTLRDGGEIRNGTVTLSTSNWLSMDATTFTFGKDSNVSVNDRFYLMNGAYCKVDGGTFINNSTANNHVVGAGDSGSLSTLEVSNGGRVVTVVGSFFLGHIANTHGALIGDGGIVDLGTRTVYLCNNPGTKATLALTNSVLTCGEIHFSYGTSNAISNQTVVLKNTLVNLSTFVFKKKVNDSSILFDGATLVPRADAATLLPSGLPTPQLGTGGLVISNAFDAGVAVGMAGVGGLVKMGDGALTVSANQSFTGDVVVSGGTFTSSSTFAGGLQAASGATLNVTNATFGGNIAVADGVVFPATNGVNWATTKAVPVAKTTASVVSFPSGYDADGRHFFARTSNGMNVLYFGKQRGLMIMVR